MICEILHFTFRFFIFLKRCFRLARNYIGRAWAFFAFSDLEFDTLAFIERCVAGCLDLRMMDKQIVAAVVRLDETESLT